MINFFFKAHKHETICKQTIKKTLMMNMNFCFDFMKIYFCPCTDKQSPSTGFFSPNKGEGTSLLCDMCGYNIQYFHAGLLFSNTDHFVTFITKWPLLPGYNLFIIIIYTFTISILSHVWGNIPDTRTRLCGE